MEFRDDETGEPTIALLRPGSEEVSRDGVSRRPGADGRAWFGAHDNDSASSMGNPEKPVAGSARVKDLGSGILDQGSGIVTPLASLVAPDDDEPAPKSKRGTRLDPSFVPSEASRVAVITDHPTLDLRREHAKFVDYWTAKSGQNATKVDWDATWRNWMRKAGEDLARHRPANRDQFAGAIARADAAEAIIPGDLA